MSYFGEQLRCLRHEHPTATVDTLVDAMMVGIECFAWMKDGTTFVGTCGSRLRDVRDEVEAARRSMKAAEAEIEAEHATTE